MTTVTGFTSARMLEIENTTIVDGDVVGDNLILKQRDDTEIDAGNVRGPMGPGGSGYVICTHGTRPVLAPEDEGIVIYETDTKLVCVWTGTHWKLAERIICTNSTRPSGLGANDEGVEIYETDTNNTYFWNGSAWRLPRGPLGRLGYEEFGEVNRSSTGNFVDFDITLTETRIVDICYSLFAEQFTSTANVTIHLTVTGESGRRIFSRSGMTAGTSAHDNSPLFGHQEYVLTAGTYTIAIYVSQVTAGAIRSNEDWNNYLSVHDIGAS